MHAAENATAVREAFSRQSPVFDHIDEGNPIIARMRGIVRTEALRHMRPGETLLELNAGTGIDSFWFAEQGLKVLATDDAPGMVAQLEAKRAANPAKEVEAMHCSFHDLDQLRERRFQHVFSNFGGLNCTDLLDVVLQGIDRVLLPGGTCALVIMPRFSPWEALTLLKGRIRYALRRFRKSGTAARLEGVTFTCYYYSPRYVMRHLGPGYDVIAQRALSLVAPPPHHEHFPQRWPRLHRVLHRLEEGIAHRWPFRLWGDHFLILLRKRP
ncbi:MAG TPA: methyltransferase domain-containing protein [Flavobacteriales bacterium]|nr:methyltransferase domain-containing protein [Flavobacteriales bacterium]